MKFHPSVISDRRQWPQVSHEKHATQEVKRWSEAFDDSGDVGLGDYKSKEWLLSSIFSNSPYLTSCVFSEGEFLINLVSCGFEVNYRNLLNEIQGLYGEVQSGRTFTELSQSLRTLRRKASMLLALSEITGVWNTKKAAYAQTEFAETVLDVAIKCLLLMLSVDGELELTDMRNPARDSGLIVLGLGKLGGRELNFSSDIDLVIFYDPEKVKTKGARSAGELFSRLTIRLVELLETRTRDGYVFRTDLRLRPDPLSTPLAVSIGAAETYYESVGQNWERAAFIKARPVAGDIIAGRKILQTLEPFIWRKTLDFAALEDIHSIKRQIDSQQEVIDSLQGHNIKLGRGGIREIEFFAQTLQLIWGGRERQVRCFSTTDALKALSAQGKITQVVSEEMTKSYWFLRRVENRLQMIEDRQTHVLPQNSNGLQKFSLFMGYTGSSNFLNIVSDSLNCVAGHYSSLFEFSKNLGVPNQIGGNLVFTGVDDDPATISTLDTMGFLRPSHVSHVVRKWHRGKLRATRNTRAREILTQILPQLLVALSKTSDPDTALINFDKFLENLPAGVQLFSLFQASPTLLDVVAEIMGTAPRLSGYLARSDYLFDVLLEEQMKVSQLEKPHLADSLKGELRFAKDFQDVLEVTRRWSGDVKFLTSVRQLRGAIDCLEGCRVLSEVADLLIKVTLEEATREFSKTYGVLPGGELGILGFGKLGGEILTRGSDLDLVFVYRCDKEALSNGKRAVTAPVYYSRLCQRLITALSVQTGQGQLYEIDIRLRPMGSSGPLVCDLSRFDLYYKSEAWTWELMALTGARVIAGSPSFTRQLRMLIRKSLCQVHGSGVLQSQALAMRSKVWRERAPASPWDIKHAKGGLFDLEFLTQYLQLRNSSRDAFILDSNTHRALEKLGRAGFVDVQISKELEVALDLFLQVQSITRICISGVFKEEEATNGLREVLVRVCGAVDFKDLKERLIESQALTYDYFVRMIGDYTSASATE